MNFQQKNSGFNLSLRDQSDSGKLIIGRILSKEGQITSIQLEKALKIQKKTNERLSKILLNRGYIDPDTIVNVLGRIYNYQIIRRPDIKPHQGLLKLFPYDIAKSVMAFPLALKDNEFSIAMVEPTDSDIVEYLQKKLEKSIKTHVITEHDLIQAFRDFYKISDNEYQSFLQFEEEPDDAPIISVEDFGSLVSEAEEELELHSAESQPASDEFIAADAPIIKLVNGIMIKAINDGVSDIHIEPFEKSFQIRYRLDGSMYKAMNLPLSIKNAVTSRIKILAQLDIAERRIPQDGRIKLNLGRKKNIDFRVSTLPTLFGESIVMRILDQSALNIDLTKLGFEPATFESLKRCISRPYGLVLVTGPTGSGKTTTLYSILNRLNKDDIKILTVEDPVEFNFKGINQVSVKQETGMTFAAALRAFLRQDPDIIMVGEIRDLETAQIAIRAALTGHLVFATLHTNDCSSTISRLIDIGIPPYMLASALSLVLSQRLSRRLCPECKMLVTGYNSKDLEFQGFSKNEIHNLKIYGPKGCSHCKGTGYKSRVGLYELMEATDEVVKAISGQIPEAQLRKITIREGMVTLREAGIRKVRAGETSIEEVLKKTVITREALPAYLINPDIEKYEDDDIIVRENNKDKDFFMLIQGGVYIFKEGKKITEITQPGEYFGEISAITGQPRPVSIISKGRSTLRRFPGDKLEEVIEKHPDVAKHMFRLLAARVNKADKRLLKIVAKQKD